MKNETKKRIKLTDEERKFRNRERNRLRYQLMSDKERHARIEKQKAWNKMHLEDQLSYVKKYQKNNKIKKIARIVATSVACPEGMVRHHYSYSLENMKDVIFLTREDHHYIHRYLKYVDYNYEYTTVSGCKLDTKEKHLHYIQIILDFKPYVRDMTGFLKMFGY